MDCKEEKICRLCLELSDNVFGVIEEAARHIFSALMLKINLSITKDPVMCKNCSENLEKCFDFKVGCMNMGDCSIPISGVVEDSKADIKKVLMIENENICRFCLQGINEGHCKSIDVLNEEMVFAENLLAMYMPEMNFRAIGNAVICLPCVESLKNYALFMKTFWDAERKILEYCKVEGTDSRGHIELRKVLDYDMLKCIKTEENLSEIKEYKDVDISDENQLKIEQEELNIKAEELTRVEQGDCDSFQCGAPFAESEPSTSRRVYTEVYRCDLCTYETKRKHLLRYHKFKHMDPLKVTTYKCEICAYETRRRYNLKKHIMVHEDPSKIKLYKCDSCTYASKQKSNLKNHALIHMESQEITMYKCDFCTYETKNKYYLKQHTLIHKDSSEITTYKCEWCGYETKHRCNLNLHIILHKDPSEITMHKCELCSYQAKHKHGLKRHMLSHKDPSEITTYKCEICSYVAKRKSNLKEHMMVHKDPSKIEMYRCELCTYESKVKYKLKRHMVTHQDPAELEMYKCELCTYQFKQKGSLKKHMAKCYVR